MNLLMSCMATDFIQRKIKCKYNVVQGGISKITHFACNRLIYAIQYAKHLLMHVETVCLLSKLHSDHHIEVELKMDELDLTAAESKATYEEIKDYVLKQSGLKVSNLYIAQVKQKCGIIERINYNLPKSENSRQSKCPPEKETAIKMALEHFQMI